MTKNIITYKCLLCDYNTNELNSFVFHRDSITHKSKKELKYISLKFDDKLSEEKIEEIFIKLEHNVMIN